MDIKKISTQSLLARAVIISTIIVLLFTECFAGTAQNRPTVKKSELEADSKGKVLPSRTMHRAFENAGRAPGLEIWRIENFEPVPYPKNNYGKFYIGDSYIVLNTKQNKDKNTLTWDIHFWLGSETSVDEAGAAAISTVHLDDALNGNPVQHREVQDHESSLFLSYFRNGVRYEKGGVGTGFKHVTTNDQGQKRLFQVKGKRNIRVRQVNLSVSSMNKGDCFILDAGSDIYVFVGSQAQRVEKMKATSAANQIRDQDHHGRSKVHIIDEFSTEAERQNFFTILGSGSPNEIPDASTAEEDLAFEKADEKSVVLYKVTDQSGKSIKIEPITQKPLKQEMLDTRDCFILDTGSGIYVWVGKEASQKEKTDSMKKAQEFLQSKKYPAWTEIHRIVEGAESAPFKQYFSTWKDTNMMHSRLIRSALGFESDEVDSLIDETTLMNLVKKGGRAISFMPENGSGKITKIIQISENLQNGKIRKKEVDVGSHILLGLNSYIISYEYIEKSGENASIVYIWNGLKSSQSIRKEGFKMGIELGNSLFAVVVRTVQGYEPRHFLKIFKGTLVSTLAQFSDDLQLYRIRGTNKNDVHTIEVALDSSSLNSGDIFALLNPKLKKIYIWIGLGVSQFEADLAQNSIKHIWQQYEKEVFDEGAEPNYFWNDLNGEGMYDRSLKNHIANLYDARLFHCQLIKNRIEFEEIINFQQSDLDIADVMLVDGGDEIYVWIGSKASKEENDRILEFVEAYIKSTERSMNTISIVRILQDHEPNIFKKIFPSWEAGFWNAHKNFVN